VLKRAPPIGPDWLHEVKHDGWRAQLHRQPEHVAVLSKSGRSITPRFPVIRDALAKLSPCIIDAELVGCDADGIPDFRGLMAGNSHGFCAWCFDLLSIGGKDVRAEPLDHRRARLNRLLSAADGDILRFSEAFEDPIKLLEAAVKLGLEGIVSKKRDQPYVSGRNAGWVKVKTGTWREANRDRWEMFEHR
jgi:bifunctional non-homologous end joining protein LigD